MTSKASIVGKFFHTFKVADGRKAFVNQGQVLSEVTPGAYLVELYEWGFGYPNGQFVKPLSYFTDGDACFYSTREAWTDAYDRKG